MKKHLLWLFAIALLPAPVAAWAQSEEVIYYHTDAIGSVRMTTNEAGAVVARYDYLPFGEPWPGTPTNPDVREYAGKERDQQTLLDYFGARYYRNGIEGFTTVDPDHVNGNIFDSQSWNAYAYARNNPFRFVDPEGTDYRVTVFDGNPFWVNTDRDLKSLEQGGFSFRGGHYIFNAAGNLVGTFDYFSPFERMLMNAGNTAEPGVNLAVGGLSVFGSIVEPALMTIAGCASGWNCSAAGVAMAVMPLKPFGMSSPAFGNLIGWTRGGTIAANLLKTEALIAELPARIPALRKAGVTAEMAREWAQFYRNEATRNPANANALPRAQLMEAIARLLGQ